MNTLECIKNRRSVRVFKPEKIAHSVIEQIIETASFSPSWKNTQISRYVVIEDESIKSRIASSIDFEYNVKTIENAPELVVLTYVKKRSGFERDGSYTTKKKDSWQMFDAGIAAQTFALAAYELGVSSVIMGIFDPDEIADIIELPEEQEVAAILAIGYETEHPEAPKRKSVEDLLTYK